MKLFMVLQMFLLFGHHYGNARQNIPDAPMLPDLDYKGLPEFIRSMIPEKRASVSGNAINEDKKIIEKTRPKTYGMSLNGDSGVVWNDLMAPKSRYQIGNSRSLPTQDLDDIIDNMIDQIVSHSTTPRPDDQITTTDHIKSTEPITTTEKPTTKYLATTKSTKLTTPKEDLARTTPKPKTQKELLKEIEEKLDSIMTDAAQYIKLPHVSKINGDAKDKPSDIDENNQEKIAVDRREDGADIKDTNPERKGNKTHKPATIENILELLLQNDDIWSWLSKNIAKNLEILMDRVGAVVQEEVKLILQNHFEENSCASNQTNTTDTENNTMTPVLDKENVNIENDKIDIQNPNDTAEELPKHHKEKPSEKQNKCEKNIIYGNSVGNERVTNVFIFNMNSDEKPTINYNNDSHTVDFNNISILNGGNKTHNEDKPTTTESAEKESEVTTENDTEGKTTEGPETNDVTDVTDEPETNDVTDVTEEPETNDDVTGTTGDPETSDDSTDTTEEPETNDDVANTTEDTSIDNTEQSEDSTEDSNSEKDGDENSNETATELETIDDETEDMSESN